MAVQAASLVRFSAGAPAVVLAVVLVGCTSSPSSPAPARSSVGGAPVEFTHRTPLPSCGSVGPVQTIELPRRAITCMERARGAGQGAELVVHAVTVEGAPITEYRRYEPGSDVLTIFRDATRDTFGSRQWELTTCPHAPNVETFSDCETRLLGTRRPVR